MLFYAERACIELEEVRIRLRSAYNQEVRDRSKAMNDASASTPQARVVQAGQLPN
jgi:hypothetical protein